jgi:SAM-dependent methyltransferase
MFSAAIAEWFGVDVIGVEPAAGMRREAARAHAHPRVRYAGGAAEHLPLRNASADVAWLSTVIHHFRDLPAAAGEAARVLRPHGVVMVRSSFPERHEGITLFRRFPAASRVAASFPSIQATEEAFTAAGLALVACEGVSQVSSPSLALYLERVRLRADTTLTLISDAEFAAGVAALEWEVAAESQAGAKPVIDTLDLLVFARAGASTSGS